LIVALRWFRTRLSVLKMGVQLDNMVKCLEDEMWDSAEVLRRKNNSVAGAVCFVNIDIVLLKCVSLY
jgi:uncharacterized membrane protein YidH (DUF202 family)